MLYEAGINSSETLTSAPRYLLVSPPQLPSPKFKIPTGSTPLRLGVSDLVFSRKDAKAQRKALGITEEF